jgi:hypothetical protein
MDVRFSVDFVPKDKLSRACHGAVLHPLLSKRGAKLHLKTDDDVIQAVRSVLSLWRKRVSILSGLGWTRLKGKSFQYARNCEPCMLAVKPAYEGRHSRSCKQSIICPWCWCRRHIGVVYHTLKQSLAECGMAWHRDKRRRGDYPYKLMYVNVREKKTGNLTALDAFFISEGRMARSLQRAVSVSDILGAVATASVSPAKDGFMCRAGMICLVPSSRDCGDARVIWTPSDRNLARLAASMCPYPRGMLLGPPKKVLEILEARKGRRLLRSTGLFTTKAQKGDTCEDVSS